MLDNKKVLVVDDEPAIAGLVGEIVKEFNLEPILLYDPRRASETFKQEKPFMVFSDLTMPGMTGIDLLYKCKEIDSSVHFVIMTGYGSIESAIEAIRNGATDYIQKPLNLDFLRHLINKSLKSDELVRENSQLKTMLEKRDFPDIIGQSHALTRLLDTVKKVASSNADVMVCGESGTGKEMIARSVHKYSPRSEGPFVAVDCVALPRTLFESEMFGYEKGAFTGANEQRDGLLKQAHGGTLFIDEVTELDFDLQAKLLRVLQERQYRRVGGREIIDIDVRIVSATRRDPLEEVKKGTFRDDLYYRLSVIPLNLPPLRDRTEDIALLTNHFIEQSALKNGMEIKSLHKKVLDILETYNWPGNIRELRNITERMFVLSGNEITVDDLPPNLKPSSPLSQNFNTNISVSYKEAKEMVLGEFTEQYLRKLHLKEKGNISKMAIQSGLSRKALYDLIKKFKISL